MQSDRGGDGGPPSARRWLIAALAALVLLASAAGAAGSVLGQGAVAAAGAVADAPSAPGDAAVGTPIAVATAVDPSRPSAAARLALVGTIRGDITPKSVVVSPSGLAFAQNMMYRHTITVYDRRLRLVRTISDEVRLSRLGLRRFTAPVRGAPVEAAFSPDGRYGYVSNYSMYGPGFGPAGNDGCSPSDGFHRSTLYRVDTRTLRIDRATLVGAVPKYVAVTPDGRYVLVTNWCDYDLSVVRAADMREIRRIPMGVYPRGIVVGPSGRYAWVSIMGGTELARLDLNDFSVSRVRGVGAGPRHLVMSPDGGHIYITLNAEGTVAKLDARRQQVVARVRTGSAPRSMGIAGDGRSLYVVNYESNTVSKVRTADMRVLQTVPTEGHPIGISYDRATGRVWVACYDGSIMVFQDR